jgi:hypothetical protein
MFRRKDVNKDQTHMSWPVHLSVGPVVLEINEQKGFYTV